MTDGDFLHEEPPAYGGGGKPSPLHEYLRKLDRALKRGDSTEHTHRPALKELLEALDDKIIATNEPKRSDCGAPDYVISRKRDQLVYTKHLNAPADFQFNESEPLEKFERHLVCGLDEVVV